MVAARSGKPERQTAAASRRTPHWRPRPAYSSDGGTTASTDGGRPVQTRLANFYHAKYVCRARCIVPLRRQRRKSIGRAAVFQIGARGFDRWR
jgi:hypothetical protein